MHCFFPDAYHAVQMVLVEGMLLPQILLYIFLVMNAWINDPPRSFIVDLLLYFYIQKIIYVSNQTVRCTTSEMIYLNPRILTSIHQGNFIYNLQVSYLISGKLSILINIKHIELISFTRTKSN